MSNITGQKVTIDSISEEQQALEDQFNLDYFQVVLNLPRLLNLAISNPIASETTARELLLHAKGKYPECKLIKGSWYYNSEHEAGRQEFIAEMEKKPTLYNRDQCIKDHMNKINGVTA